MIGARARLGAMASATVLALALAGCTQENLAEVEGYTAKATDSTVVITFYSPSGLDIAASVEHDTSQTVSVVLTATSSTDSHLMDRVCQQVSVPLTEELGTRTVEVNGVEIHQAPGCPAD